MLRTLQVTNSKNEIDSMNLFSNNSNRVEFHVGQSNATNKCAVLRYNVNPTSLSFGFYKLNNIMNLDPNSNLSVNGNIISPTITSINSSLDSKAPLSHTHSISDITNLQTTLNTKAPLSHTHTSSDITDIETNKKFYHLRHTKHMIILNFLSRRR